jgi:hypothetical protein
MALVIEGTHQELFDKIVKGLDAQEWRQSRDEYGVECLYLNERGDRCAVGHLLGDLAKDATVRGSVLDLVCSGILEMSKETEGFLCLVQALHDRADEYSNLKESFQRFAWENDLKWNLPR